MMKWRILSAAITLALGVWLAQGQDIPGGVNNPPKNIPGNAATASAIAVDTTRRINQSYDNTGDTTQDFKVSLKIPAGTLGANSIIDIRSTIQGSNSLGTCENDIYLSTTSNGAADGTKIGVNYTVNGQGLSAGTMVASCTNQNSVSSQSCASGLMTATLASSFVVTSPTFNTATTDLYLKSYTTNSNASGHCPLTQFWYEVK